MRRQALTLDQACKALAAGAAVAFPTPCGYGFALDPWHEGAQALMARLKPNRRDPVGLIAGDLDQVRGLVSDWPQAATRCAQDWPGEVTVVLKARSGLPSMVRSSSGGVALRVPVVEVARQLALEHGSALTATSLNRPGESPARSVDDLEAFAELIAGYLPGEVGDHRPSTLVDLTGAEPRVLRQGAVELSWL